MTWDKDSFTKTLRRFDFGRHRSHHWLLAKRARRESILQEAGLLDILRAAEEPRVVGNLVRTEQEFDWGQVRFQSAVDELDDHLPCSIYAAFEYFIRRCNIFPMFIKLSDVRRCGMEDLDALPVYGSRFSLEGVPRKQRNAVILSMLQLHGIQKRPGLLVNQIVEVNDNELFALYFEGIQSAEPTSDPDDPEDESGLDHINVWHT